MASSWLPFVFVAIGTLVQGVAIVFSRKYGIAFWILIPIIIVHQYFFLSAYTKAANFTFIWFFAAALTSIVALIIGHLVFHDIISWKSYAGIVFIVVGIVLTKL